MNGMDRKRVPLYTAAIFAAMWMLASVHAAMGAFQTGIIDTYALTSSSKGVPSGIATAMSMIAFALVIVTVGRIRKAVILMFGTLTSAIGLALLKFNSPFGLFLILQAAVGFSTGCVDALASATVSDLHPGREGAGCMCALHATYGASGFAMPFVIQAVISGGMTWRSAYLVLAAGELAACAALYFTSRGRVAQLEIPTEADSRFSLKTLKRVFSNRSLRTFDFSMLMIGMYLNCMLVWTPRFMEYGFDSGLKTVALSGVYLGVALSRVLMAFFRADKKLYLRAALPLAALSLLLSILTQNEWAALIGIFLSAFFSGPAIPLILNMAANVMPKDSFIINVSTLFMVMLGETVCAPIFGKLETLYGVKNAMVSGALFLVLAWVGNLLLPKGERG